MGKTFQEWNPEQSEMFPATPLDMVERGDLVHLIRGLVLEQLDLSQIMDQYQEERGQPPFHPKMMTALLLYSYCGGIYASRRIARACRQRVDYMALLGMQKPDFRTINLFRQRHLKALGGLFGQVVRLCAKAGLVKLGHVALDGTKLKANASKHKAMSYGRMKKEAAELDEEIERWFREAERQDREDDATYGADRSGDELPDWVSNKEERLKRIRQAKADLEAEARKEAERKTDPKRTSHKAKPTGTPADKKQRNFTDPDSSLMKTSDGFVQGYNGQAAVDGEHQVIVAQTLSNNGNDVNQMTGLLKQIKENLGRQAKEVSADAGYCSERNLIELVRRHIRSYISTACHKNHREVSERVQQMRARIKRGGWRTRYRLRKQIVEPVFGQIKSARGFRQFLLRGQQKVAAEWSLLCTAHNLIKLAGATR
jgi:transposase